MSILYTLGLFIITAIAEIVGCYLDQRGHLNENLRF